MPMPIPHKSNSKSKANKSKTKRQKLIFIMSPQNRSFSKQKHEQFIFAEENKSNEESVPPLQNTPIGIPTIENMDYQALADRCLQLLKQHPDRQIFVGIAGTPGSGKSFIADEVRDVINDCNNYGNKELCVIIPMDGYHLSRAQLKDRVERGALFKTEESGVVEYKQMSYDQLMQRRGAPFTFWPEKLIHDLQSARNTGEGSFPAYVREKHDPVPDQVKISPRNRIILVEGLYLLSFEDPDWQPLEEIWDDRWYVDVSMAETRRRLIHRHLKHWTDDKTRYWGGDDEAAAARKADANDMKNARWMQQNARHNAKLIISNETIPEKDEKNEDCTAAL